MSQSKEQKSVQPSTTEKYPAGAWAKSYTARPWSSTQLGKGSRAKRKSIAADAVMNEEWSSLHAAPLFWLEAARPSRFQMLQEFLIDVEATVERVLIDPLKSIQSSIVQK